MQALKTAMPGNVIAGPAVRGLASTACIRFKDYASADGELALSETADRNISGTLPFSLKFFIYGGMHGTIHSVPLPPGIGLLRGERRPPEEYFAEHTNEKYPEKLEDIQKAVVVRSDKTDTELSIGYDLSMTTRLEVAKMYSGGHYIYAFKPRPGVHGIAFFWSDYKQEIAVPGTIPEDVTGIYYYDELHQKFVPQKLTYVNGAFRKEEISSETAESEITACIKDSSFQRGLMLELQRAGLRFPRDEERYKEEWQKIVNKMRHNAEGRAGGL
jgi:hypothetical protein